MMTSDTAARVALCDLRCWQPSTCLTCHRQKAPKGRSLPLATAGAYCDDGCPGHLPNPRHLWDEHDDARNYTDPGGWANHVANCDRCGGTDDDD
jgi:hypothetical protein